MKKTIKILLISIFTIVLIQTIVLAAGSIDTNIRIGTTPEISANKQMTSRILSYLQLGKNERYFRVLCSWCIFSFCNIKCNRNII